MTTRQSRKPPAQLELVMPPSAAAPVRQALEAATLGYWCADGDDKLTASVTFKCADEMLHTLEAVAKTFDLTRSEWVRRVITEKLLDLKRQGESLSAAFAPTTDTANTTDTPRRKPRAAR